LIPDTSDILGLDLLLHKEPFLAFLAFHRIRAFLDILGAFPDIRNHLALEVVASFLVNQAACKASMVLVACRVNMEVVTR
jgi:hypothetical protein